MWNDLYKKNEKHARFYDRNSKCNVTEWIKTLYKYSQYLNEYSLKVPK